VRLLQKPVSNIKELNPYWKNDGKGLPSEEEKGGLRAGSSGRLPPPPGVGDGGASWRMKALKRAQEQAAREGRKLDEVCVLGFCDGLVSWFKIRTTLISLVYCA